MPGSTPSSARTCSPGASRATRSSGGSTGPRGTTIPVLVSASLARPSGGARPDLILQLQDLRERRRAQRDREQLIRAQAARASAEATAERLRIMQSIAVAALGAEDLEELLRELLDRILEALDVDRAAVVLTDEARAVVARAAGGVDTVVAHEARDRLDDLAERVVREGGPLAIADVPADGLDASSLGPAITSLLAVPLTDGKRVIGSIHVGTLTRRDFDDETTALLRLAADRAGLAIARTRLYERERGIAQELQRSLLPKRLPPVPGVALDARYLPGVNGTSVGGDWYDAIGAAERPRRDRDRRRRRPRDLRRGDDGPDAQRAARDPHAGRRHGRDGRPAQPLRARDRLGGRHDDGRPRGPRAGDRHAALHERRASAAAARRRRRHRPLPRRSAVAADGRGRVAALPAARDGARARLDVHPLHGRARRGAHRGARHRAGAPARGGTRRGRRRRRDVRAPARAWRQRGLEPLRRRDAARRADERDVRRAGRPRGLRPLRRALRDASDAAPLARRDRRRRGRDRGHHHGLQRGLRELRRARLPVRRRPLRRLLRARRRRDHGVHPRSRHLARAERGAAPRPRAAADRQAHGRRRRAGAPRRHDGAHAAPARVRARAVGDDRGAVRWRNDEVDAASRRPRRRRAWDSRSCISRSSDRTATS